MILVENVYLNRDGSRLRNSSASHYHDMPSTLFNDSAISGSGSSSREADLKNMFVSRKQLVLRVCLILGKSFLMHHSPSYITVSGSATRTVCPVYDEPLLETAKSHPIACI